MNSTVPQLRLNSVVCAESMKVTIFNEAAEQAETGYSSQTHPWTQNKRWT